MKDLLQKINSPIFSIFVTACLYLMFLLLSLGRQHWDPSRFVHAGDKWVNKELAPENLYVFGHSDGYDGQFYYQIALNPFSHEQTHSGVTLDNVAHRRQRIVYPFLAWLISFGQPEFLPVALILINYLSLCCIGFIGGVYARGINRHSLWGLVFPLYAGFLVTLSRDLTEILEITLLLSVFVFMARNRTLYAAIFLSFAVLTRESAMLVVVAFFIIFITHSIHNRTMDQHWELFIVPGTVYLIWRGWVFFAFHLNFEVVPSMWHVIGLPFQGFVCFFIKTIPFGRSGNYIWFSELCLIIIFTISVYFTFRSSRAKNYEKYSWLLYSVFIFMFTDNIWIEDWAFLRIISEFALTGSIILLNSKQRFASYILYGSIASWFLLGVNTLRR